MFKEDDCKPSIVTIVGMRQGYDSFTSPSQLISLLVAPFVMTVPRIIVVQYLVIDETLVVVGSCMHKTK